MRALGVVVRSPLYRGATLAMLLSGLGYSAAAPYLATFLVTELGASLSLAGLFFLTNLTAPIAGYLVGARSDRSGRRLGLFRWCALLGGVAWVAMANAQQVWLPFAISAVLLGFSGAATAQLFAVLRDDLDRRVESPGGVGNDTVFAVVRMALTLGWVVGPVLGAWLAAQFGLRPLLLITGLITVLQAAPLGLLRDGPGTAGERHSARPHVPVRLRELLPLLLFIACYVLVYAGESVKYAYLPIYLATSLHAAPAVVGAAIGIQPLVELVIMPFAVVLARRVGPLRLMAVGATFGVAANLCFALTGPTLGVAGMFVGQVFMGGVWGIFAVIGIVVAQRLLPRAIATASAIFVSAGSVSYALGGLTASGGVAVVGLPLVFLGPALYGGLATIGLLIMSTRVRLQRDGPARNGPGHTSTER